MEEAPTFRARIRARGYELDSFGHVNHATYLNYFEEARWQAMHAAGFPLDMLRERGWGIHVVRVEVDYMSEVRAGDALRISTRVEGFRKTSMTLAQRAVREPDAEARERVPGAEAGDARAGPGDAPPGTGASVEVVAEARVVAVWVDRDGRPMRVPSEVRSSLGDSPEQEGPERE